MYMNHLQSGLITVWLLFIYQDQETTYNDDICYER